MQSKSRRFIQYNMWKNCNNNCEFCFNRGGSVSNDNEKLEILQFVKTKLLSEETDSYNEIGFIGGEFFDDQLQNAVIKSKFYELFEICAEKIKQKKLDKICIATSLIFDSKKFLLPFLKFIDDLHISDNILICTSFDLKYRFHTKAQLQLWQNNMIILQKYLRHPVHTEIIVTQFFIDSVINNQFNITEFQKKYNTFIDFIEPTFIDFYKTREKTLELLPDFFPTRRSFMSFIQEYGIKRGIINLDMFLSIKLRSDTSYYKLDNGKWVMLTDRWNTDVRRIDQNGNIPQIYSYSDSDRKMTDDVLIINNGII